MHLKSRVCKVKNKGRSIGKRIRKVGRGVWEVVWRCGKGCIWDEEVRWKASTSNLSERRVRVEYIDKEITLICSNLVHWRIRVCSNLIHRELEMCSHLIYVCSHSIEKNLKVCSDPKLKYKVTPVESFWTLKGRVRRPGWGRGRVLEG
jgi:hypothetical protein